MFFAGFRHSVADGGLALPDLTFKMEWGFFGAAPALIPRRSILRGCATPCTLKCLDSRERWDRIPHPLASAPRYGVQLVVELRREG